MGTKLSASSRDLKGSGVSTNPFALLDDHAHKVVDDPKVTTGFTFKTRTKAYTREIPVWRVFQDSGNKAIYRDEQGYCYATSSLGGHKFPVSLNLTHE